MTREDRENALHCLKVMIDEEVCEECKLYGSTGTDHCEADCVRTAIKALEQEPCDDAISRKAVLDEIQSAYDSEPLTDEANGVDYINKEIIEDFVESLPPVTPQPKIGHWIMTEHDLHDVYSCSECGSKTLSPDIRKCKFCYNCGTKMFESQEV